VTRIYTIGGFPETARAATGMETVHRQFIAPYDDRPDIDVQPLRPWKSDWKGLAARAHRGGVESAFIIAYSWGAGWGAQRLARYLAEQWIDVDLMLLCDPVYRPLWLPSWGFANLLGFRALTSRHARIRVPDNVHALTGIRQENNRPAGHPLQWQGRVIHLPKVTQALHTTIDSSPAWEALVQTARCRWQRNRSAGVGCGT